MVTEPSPLQGTLRLFQTEPIPLPYFETNAQHPNKLIFIPGLTDTIGVVPYLPSLASVLNNLEYSLVQFVKCSDLGGFGVSTLEGDAPEIAQLAEHLLTRSDFPCTGKLVLMGHSTGCQDVVTFLSKERLNLRTGRQILIHGGICQAPVSDSEYFDARDGNQISARELLKHSQDCMSKGLPGALLDRSHISPVRTSVNGRGEGNSAVVLKPPFTAYRFASLNGHHGDDDLFSSYLDCESICRTLQPALKRAPLLMLFGMNEYVYKTDMAVNMHHLMWTPCKSRSIGKHLYITFPCLPRCYLGRTTKLMMPLLRKICLMLCRPSYAVFHRLK